MTPRRICCVIVLAAALVAGCQTDPAALGPAPPAAVDNIDQIVLRAAASAVNWDDDPGADGVQIRVDLFRLSEALPVMVSGALEFTMYEGFVTKATRSRHTPFRTWRITGKELSDYASRDMFGWGYVVPLAWEGRAPTTSAVTLAVRYTSPAGDVVDATPVTISTGLP